MNSTTAHLLFCGTTMLSCRRSIQALQRCLSPWSFASSRLVTPNATLSSVHYISRGITSTGTETSFWLTSRQFPTPPLAALCHPASPRTIGWIDLDELAAAEEEEASYQTMNRNARRPKKANHGKRPCSRIRRRTKRRQFGNWRR